MKLHSSNGMLIISMFFLMLVGCKTIQPKWKLPEFLSKSTAAKPPTPQPVVEPAPAIDPIKSQIDLLMAIGESHENHNNLVAAAKAYEEVLKKDKSLEASHRLALVRFKLGDRDKAFELLSQCLKKAPKDVELIADIGYLRHLNGDLEEAEKMTRRGLELDADSSRLHNNLGLILVGLDRADEALEEFIQAGCDAPQAYSNIGHAYVAARQVEKAEQYLQVAATSPQPCAKAAETLDRLAARSTSIASR